MCRTLPKRLRGRSVALPKSLTPGQLLVLHWKLFRKGELKSLRFEMLLEKPLFGVFSFLFLPCSVFFIHLLSRTYITLSLLTWIISVFKWLAFSQNKVALFFREIKERVKKTKDEKRAKKAEVQTKAQKSQGKGGKVAAPKGPKLGGGGGKRWVPSFVAALKQSCLESFVLILFLLDQSFILPFILFGA